MIEPLMPTAAIDSATGTRHIANNRAATKPAMPIHAMYQALRFVVTHKARTVQISAE